MIWGTSLIELTSGYGVNFSYISGIKLMFFVFLPALDLYSGYSR